MWYRNMTRFELEQAILLSWNTKEDIDLAIKFLGKIKFEKPEDADTLSNLLIGISALHQERSEQLFEVFEQLIHDKKIL